jgi:fatty-acyl-CoA synthase
VTEQPPEAGDRMDYLRPRPANYVPLSPVSFLDRTASIYPDRLAIIDGAVRRTYREFAARAKRLARALIGAGVGQEDVVAVLLPNRAEMLEAHFGVPAAGGVICPINTRLDAASVRFILEHSRAKVFLVDAGYDELVAAALPEGREHLVVRVSRAEDLAAEFASTGYEAFLAAADPALEIPTLVDEWRSIALNYTSGTTGKPKGVLLHHRGAYLNACGNALTLQFGGGSRYLWTLPMFHCNGWCHAWAVTLAGGTHVCLHPFRAADALEAVTRHEITHLSGAPVVLNMLMDAAEGGFVRPRTPVRVATGGAAPASSVIARMETMGFDLVHLYGMTECYGPAAVCLPQDDTAVAPLEARAAFMARQGVAHPMAERIAELDAEGREVARDATTMGELAVRSNTVMKGYLRDPEATEAALAGGWLHTGDLAVWHSDGYVEIKDRSKDIIISGGENISSLEIEEVLLRHPLISEAAVVAHPDPKWGETPHAFVTLRAGAVASEADLLAWCRDRLAGFKRPRRLTFCELPKTSTGKIQKSVLRASIRDEPFRGT